MNKSKLNYERRVRYYLSATLLSSLFLFPPTYIHATSMQEQGVIADEDKETKLSVTIRVVSEVSQEPLIGAVVRCEGVSNPSVTDIDGRCVVKLKRASDRMKLTVSYVGYKAVTKVVSIPDSRMITLQLKDDSKQLDNVTVTALKRHTSVLQQSSAISQEALEKGGATSLAKLLETIPGVSSISTGNTIAKPVIQGMHSSRILLMNNGVRLESQSWGADHAPELDYTGSSMVEVVKGAECIRYGFGAMGGVVLLNDAPLPYENKKIKVNGNVNMGYDTNARGFSGSGTIETGYKQFGLRLHGMYTKGGDYRTADYVLNNTGYNTISFSALAGWQGKKLTATLFSSIYYQRSGIYYASKISDLSQLIKRFEYGRPDPETVKPFSYEIKPPFQQSQHVTLKGELKWELNPNHHLNFTLSFQENLRQEFENRKKTQWSWIPMQDLMLKTYKFDVLWQAKWKLWKMTTDAGLSNTYQTNFNYPGTKQPAFVPNFAALSMGGYFLQKAEFGKLQCALGMRYDFRVLSVNGYSSLSNYTYYDDFKLYSNFTMSLATHYQFSDKWDARANIGWSWRPPDINELYAIGLQDGSYWVVGNKNLASERGYKLVLGTKYRNTWFSVEPSFFFQRINSYIYDHIGTGKDRFHNHPSGKYPKFIYDQDDVKLYGGDIEATVKPIRGLTFVGKGEWMFARNLTHNDWLPFMPSDRYGLSATYDLPLSKNHKYRSLLSLSGIYVTKQTRFDPDKDLVPDSPPAYFLLNGTAEFRIGLPQNRELKFMIVGDNILNALYKEYTDRFRYYAHERGANFSLRTLFKF
ncbi:TonB-dependent receptor [Prevotella melaninogenica]|uniref:TonB-dependent receptor n=2 Tax=Prevotella TaxID=838 RepID=A0ABX7XSA9_9BACT|nr:TonB-dependent receptor [Prevotella melaninogenica]QUB76586.1 TonB-dependent receptor [Prevotella melaninogenica]